MATEISKGLKWTFFINFIVSLVFGVLLFFLVEVYLGWLGIDNFQVPFNIGGFFGGALLAFSSASFIAWKQTEWEKVKILVIMNIVWNMLGAYIFYWVVIGRWSFGGGFLIQPMILLHFILFFGFLAAFIFFYIQHEKEKTVSN